MKKICYSILGFIAASLLMVSCDVTGKGTILDPSTKNAGVSFLQKQTEDTEMAADAQSFNIVIGRSHAKDAVTVALSSTLPEDIVVPSSVSFAAGESEATLSLDLSKISVGKTYSGKISFADESSYDKNYSIKEITVKIAKAYTWEKYGTCLYTDDVITAFYTVENLTYEVEVEKAVGFEVYKVLEPYGANYPYNEPGDWKPGATWVFNCTDPDAVTFDKTALGIDWGPGVINIEAMAKGRIDGKVITFPTGAFKVTMGKYQGIGNENDAFELDLNL